MRTARILIATAIIAAAATACDDGAIADEAERFAADTTAMTATTPTAGPLPAVPAADGEVVRDAMDFRLTDENFAKFAQASEALSFLRAREADIRAMLEQAGTASDTASSSLLERLEQHPQVSQAITNAGMTVRDYYVMAIAIRSAQEWAGNPQAAPPTPVGQENATWVRNNQAQLAKLQTWGAAVAQ